MKYQQRSINPVALWENFVIFPPTVKQDEDFAPLVQCPNPEHQTSKRHFQINLREPKVHCFARCGISGSYEHAISVIEGLYEKYNVDLDVVRAAFQKNPRDRTVNEREHLRRSARARRYASKIILRQTRGVAEVSKRVPVRNSSSDSGAIDAFQLARRIQYETFIPQRGIEYLSSRGISAKSISTWELGWLPEEKRIVIPVRDENGHCKFLIKRAVLDSQHPKYLYTEGFSRTSLLFGLDRLNLGMVQSRGLALVEGSFNTIRLHQHGLEISLAIMGTGLSEAQRRIISRIRPPKIFLFFDRDAAGIKNIEIAAQKLRKYPLYVVRYPKGRDDPAELTKKEAWRQFERAISLHDFKARVSKRERLKVG